MSETPILRTLSVAFGIAESAPDSELLRRFAESDDRTAFELVVHRHAELVWGVCRSALPRDPHAAEDAFQATFLILARKATTVRDGSAAGWLFRVARNVAVRARGRSARHSMRSLPDSLATAGVSVEEEAARQEVVPVVAEEVDRLTAKLREAVVLCFFEGHTQAEAARHLGWPIGTVASRLARAKDVLRGRLTRRGVVLPAGGVATVLTATQTAMAVPAALVRDAVAITAGDAKGSAPTVHSLSEGALSAMQFAKLKPIVAAMVVVAGVTAAVTALSQKASAVRVVATPSGMIARTTGGSETGAYNRDDRGAKEQERRELKLLQGKWRVVKIEVDGKELPVDELAKMRYTIRGDEIEQATGGTDGEKMKLSLSPGSTPKEFNLTAVNGPNGVKGRTTAGIYKLEDDKLTLCGRKFDQAEMGRPKEFKAAAGVSLAVLERVKDEKDELAALAGEWKGVSLIASGRELPAEEAAKAKWVIKDAEIVLSGESDPVEKAKFKLDSAAVPPTIEITITEGPEGEKGNVLRGIYFRQDDRLYFAFRDPKTKKDDRPQELKLGEDIVFVVFIREPKK